MELATPTAHGEEADGGVVIIQHSNDSASCRWTIQALAKRKQRTLYSRYFSVGGYDWRLLVYPAGDSQALPGYVSLYLQARFSMYALRHAYLQHFGPRCPLPTLLMASHTSQHAAAPLDILGQQLWFRCCLAAKLMDPQLCIESIIGSHARSGVVNLQVRPFHPKCFPAGHGCSPLQRARCRHEQQR